MPARSPNSLCVGTVVVEGELHLTFRYPSRLFGPEAAERFAACYVDHLCRMASDRQDDGLVGHPAEPLVPAGGDVGPWAPRTTASVAPSPIRMIEGERTVREGLVLAVIAVVLLFAEVVGKSAVAIVQLAWEAFRPGARHA